MIEKKLAILASVYCSKADIKQLKRIIPYFKNQKALIFQFVQVLWPELQDPLDLKFLFDVDTFNGDEDHAANSLNDILVQCLEQDSSLIPLVETNPDVVLERYDQLIKYVTRDSQIDFNIPPSHSSWIKNRIIHCNNYDKNLILYYQPLWSQLELTSEFNEWVNGVLFPLNNTPANNRIHIEELIKMDSAKRITFLLGCMPSSTSDLGFFSNIFLPMLRYYKETDLDYYTSHYVNPQTYKLENNNEITILSKIYEISGSVEVGAKVLGILYENGQNYFKSHPNKFTDSELRVLLTKIGTEDSSLYLKLLDLIRDIDDLEHFNSFKTLFDIQEGTEAQQYDLFTIYSRSFRIDNISELEKDFLFNKLSLRQKLEIIIESLIEKNNLSEVKKLLDEDPTPENNELLIKNFWKFFYRSENIHDEAFKIAETILSMIPSNFNGSAKRHQLEYLFKNSRDLSQHSINLHPHGFKPNYLLNYKDEPMAIISNLLELNPKLYKMTDKTQDILSNLNSCFDKKTTEVAKSKLLALHIDHALVNRDFMFAYQLCKEWFAICKDAGNDEGIGKQWLTIFQVGKFIDPEWPDNEAPTEILILQMEILSELLQYSPIDQIEIIATQWSALEVELSIRDLSTDTSISNDSNSLQFIQNSLNEVSHTMAAFLGRNR